MSPPLSEQSVFLQALQLTGSEARKAYLDAVCERNSELRGRVEALLRADEQAGDFLVRPPEGLTGNDATERARGVSENPGDRIHRYKLLEKIGEGGLRRGLHGRAEEPVRRRVALKIIKLGMDTRQVIARFEAERQALALMDHPNIAKVFDAGATDTGRPYFVMELVRGVPITEYCDQNKLWPRGSGWSCSSRSARRCSTRIRKGSSTATSSRRTCWSRSTTATPVPKVIDFGIAKATAAAADGQDVCSRSSSSSSARRPT